MITSSTKFAFPLKKPCICMAFFIPTNTTVAVVSLTFGFIETVCSNAATAVCLVITKIIITY